MKRRQEVTDTVLCHRDGEQWGQYVRAGERYTITYPRSRRTDRNGHGRVAVDVAFRNEATKCGTFMRFYAFTEALERGDLEIVAV